MNKRSLLIGSVLLLVTIIVFSCRRDFDALLTDEYNVSPNGLENAKVYYLSHATMTEDFYRDYEVKVLKLRKRPNRKKFNRVKPIWDQATSLDTRNGKIIVVPTYEKLISSKKVSIRRFFVFQMQDDRVNDGEIIEVVGMEYNVNKKLNELVAAFDQSNIYDFTGAILRYDLNYKYKSGKMYRNGLPSKLKGTFRDVDPKLVSNNAAIGAGTSTSIGGDTSSGGGETGGTTSISNSGPCMIVYWYTWQVDGYGNIFNENYQFLYIEGNCSSPGIPGGGSPGGNTGDYSGENTGSNTGSDTGGVNSTPTTGGSAYGGNTNWNISNQIQNPCTQSAVSKALYIGAPTEIKNMFMYAFQLPSSNVIMQDTVMSDSIDAKTRTTTAAGSDIYIKFNSASFNKKSEQYNVATVYHEVFHAYLRKMFPTDQSGRILVPPQHEYIANHFVTMLTSALTSQFLGMSFTEANALAWGGLKETSLWNIKTDTEKYNINFISTLHQDKERYDRIGTYCN